MSVSRALFRHDRRRALQAVAGATLAGPLAWPLARGQGAWPTRPITFIVPFPAGGGTDAFARPLTAVSSSSTSASRSSSTTAAAPAARSAPVAATAPRRTATRFFMGAVHHAIAPSIYPKLDYSLETDFFPSALIASVPQVIVVNPQRVRPRT